MPPGVARYRAIGERIRQFRGNRTQSDFAQELDVTRGYLSVLEIGNQQPSREFLLRLQAATRCNINWVLTGDGEPLVGTLDGGAREALYVERHGIRVEEEPEVASGATAGRFGYGLESDLPGVQMRAELDDGDLRGTNLLRLITEERYLERVLDLTGAEFERLREWLDRDGDQGVEDYLAALGFLRSEKH
jgi:transcriptional regulator with XRE-family HTH domain